MSETIGDKCDECWEQDADTLVGVDWHHDGTPVLRLVCEDCKSVIQENEEVTAVVMANLFSM